MATIFQEKTDNPSVNVKTQKNDNISENYNTKFDNISKNDSSLKKLYLPAIQKKNVHTMPVSSISKRLKKSQSQSYLIRNNKTPSLINPNSEKEKILLAKYSLARIKVKINDLVLSNKKLMAEKEANLNIIKSAIISDDPAYTDDIFFKIEQFLEETLRNTNKKTISTINYENLKSTEDKMSKIEENKEKMNKTMNKEEKENFNIKVNTINYKEEKKEEDNNNNQNQNEEYKNKEVNENSKNQNDNYEQEKNKNELRNINNDQKNIIEENNNNKEEIKNNEENNHLKEDYNSNEYKERNQENHQRHNYSIETRSEDINKVNSFNNSHLMNNNTSINNAIINNSIDEQIKCIKEIIEEKNEEKSVKEPEKVLQIESGIFEKSSVPSRKYSILKVKTELSTLKYKLISIQQKIRLKEEEITEIKSKAKMKNILFQKNILDSKMISLHKMQNENKMIEEISLPNKNLIIENLKKELKYYNEINKTYLEKNKDAEEDYLKKKTEYEEKTKIYTNLEIKNNNLKYKFNALKLSDLKKQLDLKHIKGKIDMIDDIKQLIENHQKTIDERKYEIDEARTNLDKKIDEYNKNRENKENKYQEMNKLQREINNKISSQKNEINKLKREIKDLDRLIFSEAEKYQNYNKKEKELVNQMIINKNKMGSEFMPFLKELEKNEIKKFEEQKQKRFKKLIKGKKIDYSIISTMKKKPKKDIEKKSTEDLPLLEEKLEYYLNNKGEKKELKEVEATKKEENEEKKEEKKNEKEKKEDKNEEIKENKKEPKKEQKNGNMEKDKK